MKNRLTISAAIAFLVGGLFYMSVPDGNQSHYDIATSVTGTGTGAMTGAPAAWTVIALPKEYKTHELSQSILKEFSSNDACLALRKCTEVRLIVEGDPLLSKGGPLDGIKWFPAVCVINTQGKLLFKRSGGYTSHLGDDISAEGIVDKIAKPLYMASNLDYANNDVDNFGFRRGGCSSGCSSSCDSVRMEPLSTPCLLKKVCPSCPFHPSHPKTEPKVDEPETPEIPDTPTLNDTPKDEEKDQFVLFAVLVGCVAGVVSYFRS